MQKCLLGCAVARISTIAATVGCAVVLLKFATHNAGRSVLMQEEKEQTVDEGLWLKKAATVMKKYEFASIGFAGGFSLGMLL